MQHTNLLIIYQRTLAFGSFSSGPNPRVRERERDWIQTFRNRGSKLLRPVVSQQIPLLIGFVYTSQGGVRICNYKMCIFFVANGCMWLQCSFNKPCFELLNIRYQGLTAASNPMPSKDIRYVLLSGKRLVQTELKSWSVRHFSSDIPGNLSITCLHE